jgi:2-oxoglutarate ferredoxin oxidoreductase subunit beta
METYGFHTIHGRAPAIATGLKVANPELDVWVITGDGDALSIGGNHFIHCLRRNVGLKILLFNNRIYGLTKGQYSPTSEQGKVSKSTPLGSVDYPFRPISLALGAGATFVARSVDIFQDHLEETIKKAAAHPGTAFVEIYQNCNIFNDGAFKSFAEKASREERTVRLVHGQPLVFGGEVKKGLRWSADHRPEIVVLGEGGVTEADLIVWDEFSEDPALAMAFASMAEATPARSDRIELLILLLLLQEDDEQGDRETRTSREMRGWRDDAPLAILAACAEFLVWPSSSSWGSAFPPSRS